MKYLIILNQKTFLDLPKMKTFADNKINASEIEQTDIGFRMGQKMLSEKEKMLVTSNFSISHNVLKRAFFSGSLTVGILW